MYFSKLAMNDLLSWNYKQTLIKLNRFSRNQHEIQKKISFFFRIGILRSFLIRKNLKSMLTEFWPFSTFPNGMSFYELSQNCKNLVFWTLFKYYGHHFLRLNHISRLMCEDLSKYRATWWWKIEYLSMHLERSRTFPSGPTRGRLNFATIQGKNEKTTDDWG